MKHHMMMTALGVSVVLAAGVVRAADKPVAPVADKRAAKEKTGDELSPAKFDKLQSLIKPHDPKKSFESVPWMTSLWQARQKAAAEDKPIVLWSGDPLPLGIT